MKRLRKTANNEHYLERTQIINELVYNNMLDYKFEGDNFFVYVEKDASEYKFDALEKLGFDLEDETQDKFIYIYKMGQF